MAATNSVAGHPIAMKVGGRRLSVSKSPKTTNSYLSTSPTAAKAAPADAPAGQGDAVKAEDYPRPDGTAANDDKEKDKQKKEEQQNGSKKDKPVFEQVKQKIHNANPQAPNNHNIKQPSGKVM